MLLQISGAIKKIFISYLLNLYHSPGNIADDPEGQLSVADERMRTILVNHLED